MSAENIRIIFGLDEQELNLKRQVPVQWTENLGINAHMLVAGKSGSGKTFTLRRIVGQISKYREKGVRIHAFDTQGDLQFASESVVRFSESTHYGLNPLSISSDPDFGGVRKRVQSFIDMIDDAGRELGPRQSATLRALLYDLYEVHGYKINDPSTWATPQGLSLPEQAQPGRIYLDIPFDDKDQAKDAARKDGLSLIFDANLKAWHCNAHEGSLTRWPPKVFGKRIPTLQDAARYASNRMRALAAGGGSKTMRLLEAHNKNVASWVNKAKKLGSDTNPDIEELRDQVKAGAEELIESFTDYVMSIETGRELDALIRYDSVDTVRSLVDRLESLVATGIFKNIEPNFNPNAPVWRYDLAPLSDPEQRMFVWTRLTHILERAVERGPVKGASEMREVIVLDEAHRFFLDKETNILDKIAKEGRKYGVGMICASQSPSHFSEDFLANVGTKILLGLDPMYYDGTVRKMKIDPQVLKMITPGKVAAIQVSSRDSHTNKFIQTRVSA